jgi:hypothetical protein
MLYGAYRFYAILKDDAVLPPIKGSTFRGVFGRALKEVVCALKRQECPNCLLRHQCIYLKVFEPHPDSAEGGRPSPPHPFVIEPPLTQRTHFSAGEGFDFTLLLFGQANQYLPYFVYAFEQMGRIGIGRRLQGKRGCFQLLKVADLEATVIYRAEDQCLQPVEPGELMLEAPLNEDIREVTVFLVTPLRVKYQEHLQAELPFHVLTRAALRRISALHTHFGNGEPLLDYKGLIARAREVQVLKTTVRWFDWERNSSRNGRMQMGGMVGEATYGGNLTEFLPLLRYAEQVHLGKATTFGLGKISVRPR